MSGETLMQSINAGVLANLHIVLIMDYTNSTFTLNCESNPALYKQCAVQWMEGWSRDSMVKVSSPTGQPTGQPLFNCESNPAL